MTRDLGSFDLEKEIAYIEGCSGRTIVAYSGGLDSCVLLNLICKLISKPIYAIHINHGLHADAAQWQDHCISSCIKLNVKCISKTVSVNEAGSQEAAARDARYLAFESFIEEDDVLLLAHHLDDQLETIFLKMFRGGLPFGLEGMPKTRKLGLGTLYRPLLGITQEEIQKYAQHFALEWIEDSSNQNVDFDRNFLRHNIFPLIETRWPNYRSTLLKNESGTRLVQAELLALSTLDFSEVSLSSNRLDLGALGKLSLTRQLNLLRFWFKSLGFEHFPGESMLKEALTSFISGGENANPKLEWRGKVLQRYARVLYYYDAFDVSPWEGINLEHLISNTSARPEGAAKETEGMTLPNGFLISRECSGVGLVIDDLKNVSIRKRRGGESMEVGGQHKSLKNLFQENATPAFLRDQWPLFFLGEKLVYVPSMPAWDIAALIAPQHEVKAAAENGLHFEWHLQ